MTCSVRHQHLWSCKPGTPHGRLIAVAVSARPTPVHRVLQVPVASPGSEVAAGAGLPKIQAGHASPGKAEEEPGARRKRDEQQLLSRLDSWTLRARKLGDWSWPPILVVRTLNPKS